jgi:methionine synthase II (cobalamin-independent)
METQFAESFARLAAAVPADVELGFHLCYGDLDGRHFVEPLDAAKMVELANLVVRSVARPIAWLHMPVPIGRRDDAFFLPLAQLRLAAETELYLGLVHSEDGVAGTQGRIAAARKFCGRPFGIASECGIARNRTPDVVKVMLEVHAAAANFAAAQTDD